MEVTQFAIKLHNDTHRKARNGGVLSDKVDSKAYKDNASF